MLVLAAGAAGCESAAQKTAQPASASALAPGPVIRGGFSASGPFTPLRGPVAVAAHGPDVYIADAGAGTLLRIDAFTGRLDPLAGTRAGPGVRLAADVDGTLYVLDPAARRIQRFGRDGRSLQAFMGDATVLSLRDLVLDPSHGRLIGVDSLARHLVAFRPLGVAYELIPLRAESRHMLNSLDAIAVAGDALYAIDARCACLAHIAFDGQVLATFGHGSLGQPERLAADRDGRLYVSDRGTRSIKVFRGGRLVEDVAFASLGLSEATDLAYADGWLYVADAAGAQVRMLRVQPASKGGQ